MPIATQVEQHHVLQYNNAVLMVAQQMKNPLADTVVSKPCTGVAVAASDLLNSVQGFYDEDYSRRNTENPISGTRRWLVKPQAMSSRSYIEDEDKFDMARDPTNDYVKIHTAAVTRMCMDRIIGVRQESGAFNVVDGGVLGTAIEGRTPGLVGTALPASQIIPAGGTGMTPDKMRLALLTLNLADFGLEDDDKLYCLISPKQKDDLLAIAQASANALNAFAIDQLITGKPSNLFGLNWIVSNRLPKDSAGNWLCPVWSKNNIVEGVWEEINGNMWNVTEADLKAYVRVRTRRDGES